MVILMDILLVVLALLCIGILIRNHITVSDDDIKDEDYGC